MQEQEIAREQEWRIWMPWCLMVVVVAVVVVVDTEKVVVPKFVYHVDLGLRVVG